MSSEPVPIEKRSFEGVPINSSKNTCKITGIPKDFEGQLCRVIKLRPLTPTEMKYEQQRRDSYKKRSKNNLVKQQ